MMIERDLQKIQCLSIERRDENWKFRAWLKFHAPANVDDVVAGLSQKYFELIDCKECGNCCRSLEIFMEKQDLSTMADAKCDSVQEFESKFTFVDEDGDRLLKPPCPMLSGNLCSIYANRPDTCRTFPHLEKPGFVSRLIGVIGSLAVCPIAFNVFEELKVTVGWHDRDGQ
ncbi:MAG: YkgJ family cysteine cluster protein [Bdellovibrionales bacterium]|nr:YkgJ family cysteine cluster protein [Bdellovibrionales bacterium]